MADFREAQYASYLVLCEELHLAHDLQGGDQFYEHTPPMVVSKDGVAQVMHWSGNLTWLKKDLGQYWFWLPTLSDWYEMLEEIGAPHVRMTRGEKPDSPWIADAWGQPDKFMSGPTREEAAARLWMAVKGEGTKEKTQAGGKKESGKTKKAAVTAGEVANHKGMAGRMQMPEFGHAMREVLPATSMEELSRSRTHEDERARRRA
jgi:hypothetical protein